MASPVVQSLTPELDKTAPSSGSEPRSTTQQLVWDADEQEGEEDDVES